MQHPSIRVNMLELGSLVGEYKIEQLVGEGGMGQVYGAIHPLIGKRAAIKVLRGELCSDPEAIDRFVLEARAVNQIGHPNIVDVFAFGSLPDGRQYMVMEWLRGESLDQRLRRGAPPLEETYEILTSICAALDAAHVENIVHRDLKPHNVFLSQARGMRPTVKLLDFGLVKLVGGDGERIERTRSGSMLGTPAYMSPEQARGRGVDHRTDLYALGVMMFELVTGRLPFVEQSAMEMVMAHLQTPPPSPSSYRAGIPAALEALILGLLAKESDARPTLGHTMDVLAELRRVEAMAPRAMPVLGPMGATLIASHPTPPPAMHSSPQVVPPHAMTLQSGVRPPIASAGLPMVQPSVAPSRQPHSVGVAFAGGATGQLVSGGPPATGAFAHGATPPSVPQSIPPPPFAAASGVIPPPHVASPFATGSVSPPTMVSSASDAPSSGGRRIVLALVGAVVVAGIAFGAVFAMRGASESTPDAPVVAPQTNPPPIDAAVVATPADAATVTPPVDAVVTAIVDAAETAIVDAAVAIEPRDAKTSTSGRPRPPSRDAGVVRVAPVDAGVVAPPPDAGATKPVDDGDGLLPTKPGGAR